MPSKKAPYIIKSGFSLTYAQAGDPGTEGEGLGREGTLLDGSGSLRAELPLSGDPSTSLPQPPPPVHLPVFVRRGPRQQTGLPFSNHFHSDWWL